MSRRLVLAASCAVFAALAVSAGPASAQPCDPNVPSCNPEPIERTETATRKLTVQSPVGTVSGSGISCTATTCTKSVTVSRVCLDNDCGDWPAATTYTLSASGGPAGYSPAWSDCAGNGTCTVFLGDEGTGGALETVTLSWVDTTAPSTTFAPPAKVGPSNYNVTAGATDNSGQAVTYGWSVDNVDQGATGSVLSLSALSNGTHSVAVRSRDAAGNWSGWVTKNVAVDKAVAVAPGAIPAVTNAATVPLSFTKDADVVKTECALDGAYVNCASGWSGIAAGTADGTHTYKVRVTDDVGNVAESAALTTVVDRTQPVLAFTDGPSEGQQVVTRTAAITFSLTEPRIASVKCKLDAGAWNACSAGTAVQLVDLADGTHVLSVQAVDTAGNSRTINRTFGVKVPAEGGGGETPGGGGETPTGGGQTPTGGGQTPTGGGGQAGGNPSPGGGTPQAPAFAVRFTHDFVYVGKRTRFTSLVLHGLPKSAKVTVVCKGGGCAGKSRTIKHSGGKLNVVKALRSLKLAPGAKLTVTARGEGNALAIAYYVVRKAGKRPTDTYRCAKAGGKLGACS